MWSFFGKMQHDVQHAKSSPSIKRDIYNCENRFSETENLLLNNKMPNAFNGHPLGNTQHDNIDFNEIIYNGFYVISGSSNTNSPGFASCSLIVCGNNYNYCSQIAIPLTGGSDNAKKRTMTKNVWGNWIDL